MSALPLHRLLACGAAALLAACGGGASPDGGGSRYEWRELFDGESMAGWQRLDFDGKGGPVEVRDGVMAFGAGQPFTAVVIDAPKFRPPALEYEISVRARKTDGHDFFCALTFPVPEKESHLTFVAGGWGGHVTGLSNIDQLDANRNATGATFDFETGRWYELRVAVRRGLVQCWVDGAIVVNASIAGRDVALRPGALEACAPFGMGSWETAAEFESVRIRALPPE